MDQPRQLVSVIVVTRNRKKELTRCLQSLQVSGYRKIEIIVVDNGSFYPVSSWADKTFKTRPKIKVIRSGLNLGAAGGRNLGLKFASGNFLLFTDDDATVKPGMISQLIDVLKKSQKVGIVQPKIYDMKQRNILQGIGCNINLLTGRVFSLGIREVDRGQYDKVMEIPTAGCIWMTRREIIEQTGGYDEEYFIPYEDLDFSLRVRQRGFKIFFVPQALAFHSSVKPTFINPILDYIGIRDADRAYRIARNKIIFMKKHAPIYNFLLFLFIFLPVYTLVHSIVILLSFKFSLLSDYWKGVFSGLIYAIRG